MTQKTLDFGCAAPHIFTQIDTPLLLYNPLRAVQRDRWYYSGGASDATDTSVLARVPPASWKPVGKVGRGPQSCVTASGRIGHVTAITVFRDYHSRWGI